MKVIGIVFTLICFCLLILGHEFGHFSVGKLLGFKINEFAVGMGPKLWSKQKGETVYSLRAVPIGGFCAFEGEEDGSVDPRAFNRQKAWKKILVLIAGSFNNIVIGIIIFTVIFTVMGSYSPVLEEVFEGKPAAQAGIQAGDRIVAVNGKEYEVWTDITAAISAADEDVLDIGVIRNGERLDFKVDTYVTEQGTKAIGIKCSVEHSLGKAVKSAFGECGTMVRSLRDFFVRLFRGQASSDDVGSIIQIVAVSGE
ncbi:MAG: site-2 protease family protein, partial [Firmicutes bacterium]|nr:site-2 protease family protein [Bacillota bacterium]